MGLTPDHMISKQNIQNIVSKYDFSPSRSQGQNFLINERVLETIVETANIKPDDVVLEVGPGFGVLTFTLLEKKAEVYAVETNEKLVRILTETAKNKYDGKLHIIKGDIRTMAVEKFLPEKYKVVANIPYNITSWFLRYMLESSKKPYSMTLLVQKEVAERMAAKPGDMSLLGLSVQYFGKPRIIQKVSKESFWPQPKVDSAIIHIHDIQEPNFKLKKELFQIVRRAFAGKRKQLHNTLKGITPSAQNASDVKRILDQLDIDSKIRPQELSLEQWFLITQNFFQEKLDEKL